MDTTAREILGDALYEQIVTDVVDRIQGLTTNFVVQATQAQFELLLKQNKDIGMMLYDRVLEAEMVNKVMFGFLRYLAESGKTYSDLLFKAYLADFDKNNEQWMKELTDKKIELMKDFKFAQKESET